jgi:hypothetical protein
MAFEVCMNMSKVNSDAPLSPKHSWTTPTKERELRALILQTGVHH